MRGYLACSVLICLLITVGESCQSKSGTSSETATAENKGDTLPADFVKFYDRFHLDSAYQMDHIVFPLEGLPNSTGDGDTLTQTRYFWQKADWKRHRPFTDPGNNFSQWFEILDDRVIEHWIQMNGTNMYMKRRFARLGDDWFLIYYQGMRPMNRDPKVPTE